MPTSSDVFFKKNKYFRLVLFLFNVVFFLGGGSKERGEWLSSYLNKLVTAPTKYHFNRLKCCIDSWSNKGN